MKKTLKSVAVALSILCVGGMATSCDMDSSWLSGLTTILENVIGITGTNTTYTYSGTATVEMYDYNTTANTYDPDSKVSKSFSMTPTVEVYQTDSAAVINLGQMTFSDGTTISDFTFTTYCYDNKIDPDGPSYLTGATCTYNGTANTEVPAACIQGTYADGALKLTTIYFQVGDKLFMGSFTGTSTTTAE